MSFRCIVALAVLLGAGRSLAAQPLTSPAPDAAVRRIELGAESSAIPIEVHVAPGLATTLLFDSEIQQDQVELEGNERFLRVGSGRDHVVVVPSREAQDGERLRMSIPFRDSAVPGRAVFSLVLDTGSAERQVEVYRHPRTAESYRQEVEQLRSELARLHATSGSRVGGAGLDGLRAWLSVTDEEVPRVSSRRLSSPTQCLASHPICFADVHAYASSRRVAVRMKLSVPGREHWRTGRAVLLDVQGQALELLPPWESGDAAPGGYCWLVVEAIAPGPAFKGPYTLKLWDAEGARTATLEGVRFP